MKITLSDGAVLNAIEAGNGRQLIFLEPPRHINDEVRPFLSS